MHNVTLNRTIAQLHDQQQIQQQQQHQERHLETQSAIVTEQDEEMVNLSNIGDLAQVMPEDIVSIPKEMILISLVSQEHALFNPKHEHYRSTQRKDAKWLEIADHVGWQETQCKSKWKALRDQYCRELKRSKLNANTNVKWKYFKVLDFLRPYALARHYRSRTFNGTNPTTTSIAITPATTLGSNAYSANNNNSSSSNNHNNATVLSNSIKIEANMLNCNFPSGVSTTGSSTSIDGGQGVQIKNESVRMMPALTAEQINSVIQQQDGNWNYLTTNNSNGSTTMTATRNDQTEGSTNIATEDALYNALVDCVTAATSGHMQSQQQEQQPQQQQHNQHQQLQTHAQNNEEEDEDPIHTFLNIESYFEKELISLIHQEDILYDNSNQNYRNVKMKLEVWDEIARKLKKSVKQCRQKWKALRDQFIREHKRLKTRDNLESMSRWKHYDALNFLQKFIKHKTNGTDAQQMIILPKIETDTDLDDQINMNNNNSPLRSPHVQQHGQQQQQLRVNTLPTLTGPHIQQTTQNQNLGTTTNTHQLATLEHHDNNNTTGGLCVTANYDEMDIENFINGDGGAHESHNDDDDMEVCDGDGDDDDEHQQHHVDLKPKAGQYSDYNVNSSSPDEDREYISLKMVTVSGQNTMTTSNISQTLHLANNHHHHSITLEDTMKQQHQQQQQQHQTPQEQQQDEFQQTQTPSTPSTSLSVQTTPNSNNNNNIHNATLTSVQQQMQQHHHGNTGMVTPTTSQERNPTKSEDDEIGAFFKAIAMKIRTANLSPVAFTDLQIDILRVINESLRQH